MAIANHERHRPGQPKFVAAIRVGLARFADGRVQTPRGLPPRHPRQGSLARPVNMTRAKLGRGGWERTADRRRRSPPTLPQESP